MVSRVLLVSWLQGRGDSSLSLVHARVAPVWFFTVPFPHTCAPSRESVEWAWRSQPARLTSSAMSSRLTRAPSLLWGRTLTRASCPVSSNIGIWIWGAFVELVVLQPGVFALYLKATCSSVSSSGRVQSLHFPRRTCHCTPEGLDWRQRKQKCRRAYLGPTPGPRGRRGQFLAHQA